MLRKIALRARTKLPSASLVPTQHTQGDNFEVDHKYIDNLQHFHKDVKLPLTSQYKPF